MTIDKNVLNKPEYRILQVFGNLGTGGAETWLMAILRYLKEVESELPVRISIHIFITNGIRSDFDDEAKSLGATLHYSTYTRKNLFGFARDWRRVLSRYDFHAIHDHQENTAGLHFLMGVGYLPPVRIAHLHCPLIHHQNYSSTSVRRGTLWLGKDLISKLGTHVLGTSKQLIGEQGYFDTKFSSQVRQAVHCGFETSRFLGDNSIQFKSLCDEFGWNESTKIILFVGRLNSDEDDRLNQKNPAFALEVARICAERNPNICMLMVGGGENVRVRLEDLVKSWGLAERLRLVGQRSDVPRFMLGSHLFMLPSLAEGLGMVVVEAQASGLPSIVSDVTPRECAVVDEMVEFLSLNAGAEAWAEKILEMISQDRPNSIVANSAIRDSGFSIQNSVKSLLECYTALPFSDITR